MYVRLLAALIAIGGPVSIPVESHSAEAHGARQDVSLSPEVLSLLKAEMGEIAAGIQVIAYSLATADWKAIQDTSRNIQASYIMEKKLTASQAEELKQALPEYFKQLDREFHLRAEKLGAAATTHDSELVAFQYSRLIESCTRCHSAFAKSRFPGFAPPARKEHSH